MACERPCETPCKNPWASLKDCRKEFDYTGRERNSAFRLKGKMLEAKGEGDIMANQLYRRSTYIIVPGFIAINMAKPFENGHTHLNNYNACKKAIDCAIRKKVPTRCSNYYLKSIQRLSDDQEFVERIEQILDAKRKGR